MLGSSTYFNNMFDHHYKIMQQRVHVVLWLKGIEEEDENKLGHPIDDVPKSFPLLYSKLKLQPWTWSLAHSLGHTIVIPCCQLTLHSHLYLLSLTLLSYPLALVLKYQHLQVTTEACIS
ncbi:hypothetical protein Fmac_000714 [Flemingia macrophylla]|uniref:Uncharacterized protein n=1 Tax=Flemingia macrophylla TaxID=520843 RepID=A0ABD1NF15_9FABA